MTSRFKYKIVNLVISSKFLFSKTNGGSNQFDLLSLKAQLSDWKAKYDSSKFPSVFLRDPETNASISFFGSGKIIITGLKTEREGKGTIERLSARLSSIVTVSDAILDYEVVNLVITSDLGRKLNLDLISLETENSIYEPNVFPAIFYRGKTASFKALLFESGKINIVGLRSEDEVENAINEVNSMAGGVI